MPRDGGGPCSGGAGAGLVRRGFACGCGSHASSCDGERWAERCVSWGIPGKRGWVGPTGYGGAISLSKVRLPRGNSGCVAKLCLEAAHCPLFSSGNFWLVETRWGAIAFAIRRLGPGQRTARFVVLVGPFHPSIYSPTAGRPGDTSPELDRSRPAGWTEGAAPRGARFSTGVDRPVENLGEALGGLRWRRIPPLSGISFGAHCAGG